MSEEKRKITEATKITELTVEEFFSTLVMVLNERQGKGESKLAEMTMKEFTESMIEVFKGRAYATAVAETNVAERVLTDWNTIQAVHAVAQPFRIRSAEDARRHGAEMAEYFDKGGRGEMAVAIAVVADGGARRVG